MKGPVNEYLAEIGAKGGKVGGKAKGKAKVRGDAEFYKALSAKGVRARRRKAKS